MILLINTITVKRLDVSLLNPFILFSLQILKWVWLCVTITIITKQYFIYLFGFCLCGVCRYPRQRLHQLKLHRRLQKTERLYRHSGAAAGDLRWFLAYDLGATEREHRHDDKTRRKITGTIGQNAVWRHRSSFENVFVYSSYSWMASWSLLMTDI